MAKYAELTGSAFITVAGPDAGTFLHNTCTNDILRMKRGDGLLAGFCGRDGKPRLLADIKKIGDTEYFLIFENTTPDAAVTFLNKYIVMEKVAVIDETSRYTQFIITGVEDASPLGYVIEKKIFDFTGSKERMIFRRPFTSGKDIAIISKGDPTRELRRAGITHIDSSEIEELRIKYGYPLWGREITGQYLLMEANLTSLAISYTKGCYTGQEVIMRMKTYGELSKKLMSVGCQTKLSMGLVVHEGRTIGSVVTASGCYGLAYINKPHYLKPSFTATVNHRPVIVRETSFEAEHNRD